ncbi:MAG: zf-HC2 domain-containing protein [Rudaea sp.]
MTAHIVNLGSPAHQDAQDLLPWFVMGTLEEGAHVRVDEHVRACTACQRDVQWHRDLRAADAEPVAGYDVDRAFAAMRTRLRKPQAAAWPQRCWHGLRDRWRAPPMWAGWALVLQAILVLGLAGVLRYGPAKFPSGQSPAYHTLGQPDVAAARLVVVFAPQTSEADMRRILLASNARIVDGPTAADAYILAVAPEGADQAMQKLRAEPSVLLIQSLQARDVH